MGGAETDGLARQAPTLEQPGGGQVRHLARDDQRLGRDDYTRVAADGESRRLRPSFLMHSEGRLTLSGAIAGQRDRAETTRARRVGCLTPLRREFGPAKTGVASSCSAARSACGSAARS